MGCIYIADPQLRLLHKRRLEQGHSHTGRGADTEVFAPSKSIDRVFRAECGSSILADPKQEPEYVCLSMSTVAGNPPHPQGYHAYVGSKAPWHDITDNLEQYDTYPPADARIAINRFVGLAGSTGYHIDPGAVTA